jgi:hypothetical protein
MLFDLRSAGRRRTVKLVYLGLALLMFVGFVGFSIGSSGLHGGIVDAITGSNGGGSSSADNAATKHLSDEVQAAALKTKTSPTDTAAWAALVQTRLRYALVGNNFDPKGGSSGTGDYTAAGRNQLTAAGIAFDHYLALKPAKTDEDLTRQMIQAYASVGNNAKAVSAQETLTEVDPTQQTFQNLALLAYQAGQLRKGDLASAKAIDLAPASAKKDLKSQLDQAKSQAAVSQIQQAEPTPTATLG